MNFKAISELSEVEPTYTEVKGEPRISRIDGRVIKVQSENGEWIPRLNPYNSFEYHLPVSHGLIVARGRKNGTHI